MMFAGIRRPRLSAAACLMWRAVLVATPVVWIAPAAPAVQAADEPVQRAHAALAVLRDAAANQAQRQQACLPLIELLELTEARSVLSEITALPLTAGSAAEL